MWAWSRWNVASVLLASVFNLLEARTASFLGLPDGCGSVLGLWAGRDNSVDSLDYEVCVGALHHGAFYTIGFAVCGLAVLFEGRRRYRLAQGPGKAAERE